MLFSSNWEARTNLYKKDCAQTLHTPYQVCDNLYNSYVEVHAQMRNFNELYFCSIFSSEVAVR